MATENKTWLWLGLLGVGGYILYRHMQSQQTALVALPAGTAVAPAGQVDASPAAIITQTAAQPAAATVPNGIDPTVYATVLKWAQNDGRPPVLAFAAAAVPSEFNSLYQIMLNFWDTGTRVPNPSPQQQFWDDLRTKYDPQHIYW